MSQGAFTQAVWGFEEASGVAKPGQKAGTLYGIRFKDFAFTPNPASERVSNIDPRGQLLKARNGLFTLPFTAGAEMSVDDIARLRFHMQGMDTLTTVATGVYQHAIRDKISTDAPTVDPATFSLEVDRDDSYAQLLLNCALDSWDINVKAGKVIGHKLGGMACRFTHAKDPVFATNAGTFAGTMYVRNNRQDSDAQDTTNDIKVKMSTLGALGVAKFKCTKGATAYGTVETGPIVDGTWYDLTLADGSYVGSIDDPMQVMWTGTGAFALNDEYTINAKRPHVTATYPSRNPLIAVKAVVTMGGTVYDIEDFDISFKRPRKYRVGTSTKYPLGILPNGTRSFSIKLKRDYYDRDFYLKMLSASSVSFDITINGDFIATVSAVSYYEKHQFTSTNAQVLAAGANIPNDKQLPESIEVVPYWDGTNVDLTEVVVGTLSSLK